MDTHSGSLHWFRRVAFWEGVSYLLLLLVGMPLKYGVGMPTPNYVIGALHGALFVAYCGLGAWVWWQRRWSVGRGVLLVVASLIPLGTFWLEAKVLRREAH
jgi:integral membrane protein